MAPGKKAGGLAFGLPTQYNVKEVKAMDKNLVIPDWDDIPEDDDAEPEDANVDHEADI